MLEKMPKRIRKLPKRFANCELRTANSNPDIYHQKNPLPIIRNVLSHL